MSIGIPHNLDIGRIAPVNSMWTMRTWRFQISVVPVTHGCRAFGNNSTNLLHCFALMISSSLCCVGTALVG